MQIRQFCGSCSQGEGRAIDGKPIWISHRGIRDDAIENTLRAFQTAVDVGFRDLETDLRATADGEIVLCHDPDLMRMAGTNHVIHETSAKELAAIPLRDGQRLAFFDDFISQFAAYNWIFDIKPETAIKTIDILTAWIEKKKARDWVLSQARFLFWDRRHEAYFLSRFGEGVCMARQPDCYRAGLAILSRMPLAGRIRRGVTYSVPPRFLGIDLYTEAMARAYQSRGARVLAYLPETEEDTRRALRAGFDEVLTNHRIVK